MRYQSYICKQVEFIIYMNIQTLVQTAKNERLILNTNNTFSFGDDDNDYMSQFLETIFYIIVNPRGLAKDCRLGDYDTSTTLLVDAIH